MQLHPSLFFGSIAIGIMCAVVVHKRLLPSSFFGFLRQYEKQIDRAMDGAGLLIALGVLFLFCRLSFAYVGNDEGSYIYEAQLIDRGLVPLRDFISRAPTLIFMLVGFFKIWGSSLVALKAMNLLLVGGILLFVYKIVRLYQKPRIAILATLTCAINPTFFLTKTVVNTTNISILCIVSACYLMRSPKRWTQAISGALLAASIFAREINCIFIVTLGVYLIVSGRWKKLSALLLGGVAVTTFVLGYFAYYIGIERSVMLLFGIAHVKVKEAVIDSTSMTNFFLICLSPLLAPLFFQRKNIPRIGTAYPELCWLASVSLFYLYYATKRAFFLSYGSEFIPIICIIAFSLSTFSVDSLFQRYYTRALAAVVAITSILPYLQVRMPGEEPKRAMHRYKLGGLIGSGIPGSSFSRANDIVRQAATPGSIILAGNLVFATENKLDQFLLLTRPMAYERDSMVYEMYGGPTRSQILAAFSSQPPTVVVLDHHTRLSLWKTVEPEVHRNFSVQYNDEYVSVYVRNETKP
jgi:hypothetical protein